MPGGEVRSRRTERRAASNGAGPGAGQRIDSAFSLRSARRFSR